MRVRFLCGRHATVLWSASLLTMKQIDALINALITIAVSLTMQQNVQVTVATYPQVQAICVRAEQLTADECLAMGFRKSDLKCFRCNELSQFDLTELKESCLKCCQSDASATEAVKKYTHATLEVCG